MSRSVVVEFIAPNKRYSLMFEDDGKVAYAYLRHNGAIVGDVWLYNRAETPLAPEWNDKKEAPFLNAKEYVAEGGQVARPVMEQDVRVLWEMEEGGPVAYVYVFEDLYGVVGVGDKPGYSRFAKKDGPLGRVMEVE